MRVGIIGQGFVGSAIREGLKEFYNVLTYDIDETKCNNTFEVVCNKSDIIFICVPTPMRLDGSCDTRILESALNNVYKEILRQDPNPRHSNFLEKQKHKKILVIKSTITPGTTEMLSKKYSRVSLCFSPEFLTEANSFNDFKNQTRIIIGGEGAKIVKQMFKKPFPDIPIIVTQSTTAEMVKYFTNCFLASKVTFGNQMYDICQAANINYDKVREYALYDERIGKSHLSVPGPDGDRGFGGHCFPKDLAAMIEFANKNKAESSFLKAVKEFNKEIRSNKDWLQMKGRAVSED